MRTGETSRRRILLLVSAAVVALMLGACGSGGRAAERGDVQGLYAQLTVPELLSRSDVVAAVAVQSDRVRPFAANPDLPPVRSLEPESRAALAKNVSYREVIVRVVSPIKGTSEGQVLRLMLPAHDHSNGQAVEGYDDEWWDAQRGDDYLIFGSLGGDINTGGVLLMGPDAVAPVEDDGTVQLPASLVGSNGADVTLTELANRVR